MELEKWVRAARKHKGWTLEAMGEALGRSKATAGFWETGKSKPSFAQVIRIAEVTGYPVPPQLAPNLANALASDEPEFAGYARPSRRVPVVGTARMGDDGFYEEISSITGAGDGHIEIATDDPNAYGLRVKGQSMFPAIRDGWYVLVEPNGTPREGEYVLLKLKDGRKMVKELLFRRTEGIEVMSVNGGERLSFDNADLDGMQAVGAVVSPSKYRHD
jgi:phage repressor protein C with HTH and peptisase S24 domain